jgi:predicted RNA polymerase sigma factor
VRAHLLEMSGETEAACEAYRAAARRARNLPQQRYLIGRATRLLDH